MEKSLTEIEARYSERLGELAARHAADTLTVGDHELNPRYFRLFAPPTLYRSSVSGALSTPSSEQLYVMEDADDKLLSLSDESSIVRNDAVEQEVDNAMLMAGTLQPQHFVYTEEQVMSEQAVDDVAEQAPTANILPDIVPQEMQDNVVTGMNLKVKKPNFWKTSGETSLQFTQNYISGNWSQGGESTNALMFGLTLKANYNDQQKIQWDNTFETRLGFTTTPSDEEHEYRTTNDLLRITSKLLLKAIKSWNYSVQVISKTQSLRSYQSNSKEYTSAFLAPWETTVSVGMDYKKSWKNFNVSVNLAPLSYRWLYVNEIFLAGRYGIKDGHRSLQEYGSSTDINSSWQIAKNIRWTSRLTAFTSYEKLTANWENTFDFAVSKYLSTKLFMHGRFDDGVAKKSGYTYFQFKEFLQFGLAYSW